MQSSVGMLIGLFAGMAAGVWLPAGVTSAIEPAGLLWFNAVRMTVIPIVMAQLILGVNTKIDGRALGRLGLRALAWFVGLLLAVALFSGAVTLFFLRWMPTVPPAASGSALGPVPGFGEWVVNLLPANVFQSAVKGDLLALILFALLFGAAVRQVTTERKQALLLTVAAVNDAMLTIVGWVMRLAPFGVAALAVTLFSRLGTA